MPPTACREQDRRRACYKRKIVEPSPHKIPSTGFRLGFRRNRRRPADDPVSPYWTFVFEKAFRAEKKDACRLGNRIHIDVVLAVRPLFVAEKSGFQFCQPHDRACLNTTSPEVTSGPKNISGERSFSRRHSSRVLPVSQPDAYLSACVLTLFVLSAVCAGRANFSPVTIPHSNPRSAPVPRLSQSSPLHHTDFQVITSTGIPSARAFVTVSNVPLDSFNLS